MLKTNNLRYILILVHTGSLILLGLGWFKNLLEIDITAHFVVDFNLFNEKRSVYSTLTALWDNGNFWPFLLIFLFGIIVPIIKSIAIYILLISKNPKPFWQKFVAAISKWAMADVFAISLFIAFLGAKAMQNTKAVLHSGFYWFSAYVLVSAVVGMLAVNRITINEIEKS